MNESIRLSGTGNLYLDGQENKLVQPTLPVQGISVSFDPVGASLDKSTHYLYRVSTMIHGMWQEQFRSCTPFELQTAISNFKRQPECERIKVHRVVAPQYELITDITKDWRGV